MRECHQCFSSQILSNENFIITNRNDSQNYKYTIQVVEIIHRCINYIFGGATTEICKWRFDI